jgi:hypothetical protein
MIDERFPNKWLQPTFLSVDDEGSLNIEWCCGSGEDNYRIAFWWDPTEGASACKTTKDDQIYEEGFFAGNTLAKWLNEEANKETK